MRRWSDGYKKGPRALAGSLSILITLALVAGPAFSVTPPSVASDKADYAPGETVTLSGADWAPGEVVHIFVNDDQNQSWSRSVDVTASAAGTIADSFQLPDWFVARYSVTATGPVSGIATTTFTDAVNLSIDGKDNKGHESLGKEEDLGSVPRGPPFHSPARVAAGSP